MMDLITRTRKMLQIKELGPKGPRYLIIHRFSRPRYIILHIHTRVITISQI